MGSRYGLGLCCLLLAWWVTVVIGVAEAGWYCCDNVWVLFFACNVLLLFPPHFLPRTESPETII